MDSMSLHRTHKQSGFMSQYQSDPVSWYQKKIRGNMAVLTNHISKEMNELNLIRCQRIPKRPGADWRDLPDEKVKLSFRVNLNLTISCGLTFKLNHLLSHVIDMISNENADNIVQRTSS